jgi:calcineurin-like phosphoesterase family protein
VEEKIVSVKPFGLLPTLINFGHDNIRRYCDRPFNSWQEMNDVLISNWNNCVKADDKVYHLGDIAMMSGKRVAGILASLSGVKYILAGNHDQKVFKRDEQFNIVVREEVAPYIEWVKDYFELSIQDVDANRKVQMISMSHYAGRTWNKSHWGAWNLYGHSHGTLPEDPNLLSIDVGVDAVAMRYAVNGKLSKDDYRPISYDEVKKIMAAKVFTPIDHHGTRKVVM